MGRRFVKRQMRPAGEVAFTAIDSFEPVFDALDMHRFAAVGSAGKRQLLLANREGVGGAAFDQCQCLKRLEGGARIHGSFDVAPATEDAAARVANRNRAAMGALDPAAARHLNENGIHVGPPAQPRPSVITR